MRKSTTVRVELDAWRQLARDLMETVGTWRLQARPLDGDEAARAREWLRSGAGPRPSELLSEVEQLSGEVRRLLRECGRLAAVVEDAHDIADQAREEAEAARALAKADRARIDSLAHGLGVIGPERKTLMEIAAQLREMVELERRDRVLAVNALHKLHEGVMGHPMPPDWWHHDAEKVARAASAATAARAELEALRAQLAAEVPRG